jgi:hypothetical protein
VNPIAFPIKLNCFLYMCTISVKFLYSKERRCESMRDFFYDVKMYKCTCKVMK